MQIQSSKQDVSYTQSFCFVVLGRVCFTYFTSDLLFGMHNCWEMIRGGHYASVVSKIEAELFYRICCWHVLVEEGYITSRC
jgi:hypothetical protein